LLCNTSVNPVTVIVPPADVHTGRIINIKMTSAAKQDKGAYPIVLKTIEGTIDSVGEIIIETNHSSRTLQSDGVAWWVISSKGK
jgi:hypothetical protein